MRQSGLGGHTDECAPDAASRPRFVALCPLTARAVAGIGLNGRKVTPVNDNVATNTQRTPSMDESAWKMRREAEIAEAQSLLTPANEHLNKRRIALSKLADEAEEAARLKVRMTWHKFFGLSATLALGCLIGLVAGTLLMGA